ncbi:MAG: peptidoglycan DD-metalloendopeptidase family protein [Patescibacteria group bacterium]|nr:peptidoglycan DD-metalloendopeptidase family protein [Patescibacteria group bacterium]
MKRGLQGVLRELGKGIAPVTNFGVKLFILPVYGLVVSLKLKIQRLALPARGMVLFILTNRYLFHGIIAILALTTALSNVKWHQAYAQDVGQNTLLFSLATNQRNEIVEEFANPESVAKNTNYLGSDTVINIPHIDFDYADEATTSPTPLPATIAARPTAEDEESTAPRTKTEYYTVRENDTISTIANRFGVNVGTILWNNNLQEKQYIRPGDVLKIPPVSGMLATIKKGDTVGKLAKYYTATADEIYTFNNLSPDDTLALGTEIIIPNGKPPKIVQTTTQIASRARSGETAAVVSSSNTKRPPDADTKSATKTKLLWPTPGRVITQYFGWKHIGLDIDGDFTSPLYASEDGVIETSGWSNAGYGLMVLINHGGGTKTRYAHASKLFVKAGDTVKRGQVIAMMGTTGRSTGTHIHYEVIINGTRVNPLGYIR